MSDALSTSDGSSASSRLLQMAREFAEQGRPAMAEAARRAAVRPSPPLEWRRRPVVLLDDQADTRPGR